MLEGNFRDKFKNICTLTAVLSGIVMIFLSIDTYECYTKGKTNELMVKNIIFCLVINVIAGLLSFLLRREKKDKSLKALTLREYLEILGIINISGCSNCNINDFGVDAAYSQLWRKLGKGIPSKNLVMLFFFIGLTVIIGRCAYNVWFYKNGSAGIFFWGDSEVYIVSFLLHILICIILIGYIIVICINFKPRGSLVLEYIKEHNLKLEDVNKDFVDALYCGGSVWIGKNYLFVRRLNASTMISIDEIVSVAYNHAFGKLYYMLVIETDTQVIIKYQIDKKPYICLSDELQTRGEFSQEE